MAEGGSLPISSTAAGSYWTVKRDIELRGNLRDDREMKNEDILNKRIEKMEQVLLQQKDEGPSENERFLICELEMIKEKIAQLESDRKQLVALQKQVGHLKDENKKLSELNSDLQKQVCDLEAKVAELQGSTDMLHLSQAAMLFEQALCSSILPDVFGGDYFATIKDLLNYLNGDQPLPLNKEEYDLDNVLQEARSNWNQVCVHLNLHEDWKTKPGKWKPSDPSVPSIFRAVDLLKRARISFAHPKPIKLSLLEEKVKSGSLKTKMPRWKQKIIEEFICSLRLNFERCKLQHPDLDLEQD